MKYSLLSLLLCSRIVFANPVGEAVTGGEVAFTRTNGNELHVSQISDRAIVEWENFSIDAGEITKFLQPGPDSVLLNKVVGQEMSQIHGRLEANGHIILMNPHGVLVGKNGVIDACSFLTISQDVNSVEFMEGKLDFPKNDLRCVINLDGRVEATQVERMGERVFLVADAAPEETTKSVLVHSAARIGRARFALLADLFAEEPFPAPTGSVTLTVADLDRTTVSLQQLRTLIPERLWVQEFSILIDRDAFRDQIQFLMNRRMKDDTIRSCFALASSKDYLVRSTMSGENIRLMDRYQEFEQSPFWRTPDMMKTLYWLEDRE